MSTRPTATEVLDPAEAIEGILRTASRETKVIFGARRGTFDLSRSQVENFFHLVDQRVKEQSNCSASSCELAIYYTDGTSRKFPSIESFGGYSETRNRYPTVVTLHLAYLISFPNAAAPEKQEIDVLIRSSESTSETIEMVQDDAQIRMAGDKIQVMVGEDNTSFGIISYTINHSRISWGLDLEGHLRGHIDQLLVLPTRSDKLLRWSAGPINLFTTVFVGLFAVNLIIDLFFSFLYKSDGATTKEQVLDVAAQYLVNGQIAKYIVASLVVSVVFFVLFSGLISRLTKSIRQPTPSFIVLNERDEGRKKMRLKRFERRWTSFFAAIGLDVAVAIMLLVAEDRFGYLIGLAN